MTKALAMKHWFSRLWEALSKPTKSNEAYPSQIAGRNPLPTLSELAQRMVRRAVTPWDLSQTSVGADMEKLVLIVVSGTELNVPSGCFRKKLRKRAPFVCLRVWSGD